MKTILFLNLLVSGSAFMFGRFSAANRDQLKADLLQLSSETKRGIAATPEQEARIKNLFEKLEKLNPTRKPLKSDLVNGDWSLEYTTSGFILGKGGFPRVGPILQKIDTTTLSAENSEVVDYFGVKVSSVEGYLVFDSKMYARHCLLICGCFIVFQGAKEDNGCPLSPE
jgi:hypothetical protein